MKRLGQLDNKGRIIYNESGLLQFTALHLLLSGLVIKEKTTIACKATLTAYIHRELRTTCLASTIYSKPLTNLADPNMVMPEIESKTSTYLHSKITVIIIIIE